MTTQREVQNLTQLLAINDGKIGDEVWVIDERAKYSACPPGTANALAGRNCGWTLGDGDAALPATDPATTFVRDLSGNAGGVPRDPRRLVSATAPTVSNNAIVLAATFAAVAACGRVESPAATTAKPVTTAINYGRDRVGLKGAGKHIDRYQATASMSQMLTPLSGAADPDVAVFEDVCFDANNLASTIAYVQTQFVSRVEFRRCRFENALTGVNAFLDCGSMHFEECDFYKCNVGISIEGANRNVRITRCTFLYCSVDIQVITDTSSFGFDANARVSGTGIEIDHCYSDGGYYTAPTYTNGTTTFAGTCSLAGLVLTDNTADFSGLAGKVNVARILVSAATGAATYPTVAGNVIHDTDADFTAAGLVEGDIVQIGTSRGIIQSVSQHTLTVEGWFNVVTGLYVRRPALTTYTAYRVALLYGLDATGLFTTHTVTGLWGIVDLAGNQLTIGSGILTGSEFAYELVPEYHNFLLLDYNTRDVNAHHNVVLRRGADAITIQGDASYIRIEQNYIGWGYDTGVSDNHNLYNSRICDNVFYRIASQAWITGPATGCHFDRNDVLGCSWVYHGPLRSQLVLHAKDGTCYDNTIDSLSLPQSALSNGVLWSDTPATGCRIRGNVFRGLAAGIPDWVANGNARGYIIDHDSSNYIPFSDVNPGYPNSGVDATVANPVGQFIRASLTGDPNGTLLGAIGSKAINRTTGAQWEKVTGTTSHGWARHIYGTATSTVNETLFDVDNTAGLVKSGANLTSLASSYGGGSLLPVGGTVPVNTTTYPGGLPTLELTAAAGTYLRMISATLAGITDGTNTPFMAWIKFWTGANVANFRLMSISNSDVSNRALDLYDSGSNLTFSRFDGTHSPLMTAATLAIGAAVTVVAVLHTDGKMYIVTGAGTSAGTADTCTSLTCDRFEINNLGAVAGPGNMYVRRAGFRICGTNPLAEAQAKYDEENARA